MAQSPGPLSYGLSSVITPFLNHLVNYAVRCHPGGPPWITETSHLGNPRIWEHKPTKFCITHQPSIAEPPFQLEVSWDTVLASEPRRGLAGVRRGAPLSLSPLPRHLFFVLSSVLIFGAVVCFVTVQGKDQIHKGRLFFFPLQ